MPVFALGDWIPEIADDVFIAPSADVMGKVRLERGAGIWYGAVLRGDIERIVVGENSNVQDGSILHTDKDNPCILGKQVTIGHKACIHGATIGDGALVGIAATVLSGAKIGEESIVAAGCLVGENKTVPPGVLVVGVPFRIARELTPEERAGLRAHAMRYVEYQRKHRGWLKLPALKSS